MLKNIELINTGDIVYSKANITNKVVSTFRTKVPLHKIIKMKLSNSKIIFCSSAHLYATDNGWEEAQTLKNKFLIYYFRQKEREQTKRIKVVDIEVYQRGYNDRSFSSIISNKERNQGFVEFYDLEIEGEHTYFVENLLVHNCHHSSSWRGIYHRLLEKSMAPMRIGLTATPHVAGGNREQELVCEGLFGPVIDTVTLEEGFTVGFLTRAHATLIKIPVCTKLAMIRSYKDTVRVGIVENPARSRIIVKTALKDVAEGRSCLIYVNQLEHGDRLLDTFEMLGYHDAVFIEGQTESESRLIYKKLFNKKQELKVVIATTVWKEGVTIPTLDCVYIAAGGKKELALLQTIGRGIGRAEGKEVLLIRDFIDSAKYLSEHCIERIGIYLENGWL